MIRPVYPLRLAIVAGFMAMTGAGFAHAADNAEATNEVIVRAGRFAAFRGDAVFGAIDLGPAQLERAGSVDQALKSGAQAALFRRSSSLTANPTVQGIGLRAIAPSGAGRALVTLDGIPQNDPFGNWVIWASLPQDALSQIHVLRGAGGGAYGAGALTGVIDMSLTPPDGQLYGRAELGEAGSHRAAFGAGAGGFAVHVSEAVIRGDAPVRAPRRGAADIGTYGRDKAVLGNWQGEVCAFMCGRVSVLAGAYDSRRDTGLAGATALARGHQLGLSFTRAPTPDHKGIWLQIWHKASDLANRSVSVNPDRAATTLANDQAATPATGDGVNWAMRHQAADSEWEIGIDARRSEGEAREFYRYMAGKATRYRVAGGKTDLAGIYGEATHRLGVWTVTGAARVDQWRAHGAHRSEIDLTTGLSALSLSPANRSATVGTARLGASYALSETKAVRVALYNGFRPPSLNELYRPFRVGNDVTEANGDLTPETLQGLEFGYRAQGERVFVDADIFYNIVHDPISNVTVGLGPATFPTAGFIPAGGALRQRRNLGAIRAYGVEAQSRVVVTTHINLNASVTVTDAKVTGAGALNGNRPAQAPEYSASVGMVGRFAPWTVSIDATFDGQSFEDDLNALPLKPSRKVDIEIRRALNKNLTMKLTAHNAFNNDIAIARSNDGGLSYDTGRTLWLGLVFRR